MKYLAYALIGVFWLIYSVPDAKAVVVCERGYYWNRGGCVVVRRPAPIVVVPAAPVVVAPGPRCYWRYGVRYCRW
jgi:hypothetical protein